MTKEGAAADAKAVGQAIENIELTPGPKGEPGQSGVYFGKDEPTDENVNVWIRDTDNTDSVLNFVSYTPQTLTPEQQEQARKNIGIDDLPTDGITPHIGANGNWFIGETDTGMPSRGEAGKSAYQYALDGGYTGSEADFAEQLASDSSEMRHIKTITLEQDVQWIYIDTDENDNPFDLKELAINVYSVGAGSNTDEAFFKVIPNTNLDMTNEKIIDIASGIRRKGSVRSMSFATYYNGSHCVSVGGYVDEVNVFDGDMDYHATFTAVDVYGMRKISHFTSLLFGSDNRNVILGKGTKIAVWGR